MFNALRVRMGILALARPPLRIQSAIRQNGYPIQRVRFTKPVLRPKTFISNVVVLVLCVVMVNYFVLPPLDQIVEELDETEEVAMDVVEEDSVFIPFPLTTKAVQPPPFRGTDPEWQEYVKFSKNRALGKKVRDDLAGFVEKMVERNPFLTSQSGKGIQVRRYWLDVDFPSGPPPEFWRSGFRITDREISWTSMPVDSLTIFRIRQALWPTAVAQSSWSFCKVLLAQDIASLRGMLGYSTKPQLSYEQILAKHIKRTTKLDKIDPLSKDSQTTSTATTETPEIDKHAGPNNSLKKRSYKRINTPLRTAKDAPQEQNLNSPGRDLSKAYAAFRTTLRQTWKPVHSYPPRGSIIVSGLVELDSPHAWIVIDVHGAWNPKTKQYDPGCVQYVVRRFQKKRQEPIKGY